MLHGGEALALHIVDVIGEGFAHLCVEVCVLLDELGRETLEQAKQVVRNEHLTVTARARANANGWD